MKPLFSAGEEVILQSKSHPQFNGEYIIEQVVGMVWKCRVTSKTCGSRTPLGYLLDSPFIGNGGTEMKVIQSELRKKHKPSGDSFETMMDKIKSPQKLSEKTS